jgi:hypothetical protein
VHNETSEHISTGHGTSPCPPGLLQQQALITETCPKQTSPQEQVGRAVDITTQLLCLSVTSCAVPRFLLRSAVCWRCRVLASSTATLEERPPVATVPPTAGAVISQLVGKKVLQLSDSHSAVPLLHPISHSLPFSASLHIYSQSSSPAAAAAKQASSPLTSRRLSGSDTQAENALVELHYVISGRVRVPCTLHPLHGTLFTQPNYCATALRLVLLHARVS